MTRNILAIALAATVGATLAGCATAPATPVVPAAIAAPDGTRFHSTALAEGVQIYECRIAAGAAQPAWSFVAPEATLKDRAGADLGTHYAGPTWEGRDGSKVVGAVKSRLDAPGANAIPWLLLTATSNQPGAVYGNIAAIQRVDTSGGTAPAEPCTPAKVGQRARVPYTAVYHFHARA